MTTEATGAASQTDATQTAPDENTQGDTQEQTDGASSKPKAKGKTPAPTPPVEPWKQVKHKLKINGREVEKSYDELIADAQKAVAATETFQNASKREQEMIEYLLSAKKNPRQLFNDLGLDPLEFAQSLVQEKQRLEGMSEVERKAYDLEQRLAAKEAELARLQEIQEQEKKKLEESEKSANIEKAQAKLESELIDAFKATDQTPTPRLLRRVAELMSAYLDATDGQERLPAQKALEAVLKEEEESRTKFFDETDPEKLLPKLPRKFLDALRKADVNQLRSSNAFATPPPQQAAQEKRPTRKPTVDDYFDSIEKRFSNQTSRRK